MPPEFAAANDNTRTPNKSSSRLTPANAPLSAKTKVPVRSSISGSFSMIRPSVRQRDKHTLDGCFSECHVLGRQPGAGRHDQRLDTGLQRRMENGCGFWAVVDRKCVAADAEEDQGCDRRVRGMRRPLALPKNRGGAKARTDQSSLRS